MTSRGTKYWDSGAIPLIAPEILGDIITQVADVGLVIDESGRVLSLLLNPGFDAGQALTKLEGQDVRTSLTIESVPKFDERLKSFLNEDGAARPVELNHADPRFRADLPIRYSFHRIGPDGALLMLGRDLSPVAEMQQQLVKAQLSLEKDYEAQREFETRFRVLMETTADAVVLLALHDGRVADCNTLAGELLGRSREELIGQDLDALVETPGRGRLLDDLDSRSSLPGDDPISATIRKSGAEVQLTPTLFRAAGDRLVMCRIASNADSGQAPLDSRGRHMKALFATGPDGMVFTDLGGGILSVNDAFLNLLGSADDLTIRGRSLSEFLQRGSVDLKVMTENAIRTGRMRVYATKLAGDYGSPRNVEVSITAINAGQDDIFAFVFREVTRSDSRAVTTDDGMQSVIELVGSATLKEIVAETTNVVERMCIETAIELTMNNRVAAAEMLGLSRQSLYVKLRKFGMLSKDGNG